MVDQFNSHAQIGVSITVDLKAPSDPAAAPAAEPTDEKNRHASQDQMVLLELVGSAIGQELKSLLPPLSPPSKGERFCCPLDEALVECQLKTKESAEDGTQVSYNLAPYGIYPALGRSHIGSLQTKALETFWNALALTSGLKLLHLDKVCGNNGHHIVESSFKAFCRAFRCLLDQGYKFGTLPRSASLQRSTKETSIDVALQLDSSADETSISTGISFLDEIFTTLCEACPSLTMQITCKGDTWVDDHHTSEDVSIAIGQCLHTALGSKAGLNRMWSANTHLVECVMDLSNRPCLTHTLDLAHHQEETIDTMSVEMVEHVFESLVSNSHMTVHLVQRHQSPTASVKPIILAAARAFGTALQQCVAVDPRRAGTTASSKGTLSV